MSSAQKIGDVGSELVFILPDNEIDHFVPLFKQLEGKRLSRYYQIFSTCLRFDGNACILSVASRRQTTQSITDLTDI